MLERGSERFRCKARRVLQLLALKLRLGFVCAVAARGKPDPRRIDISGMLGISGDRVERFMFRRTAFVRALKPFQQCQSVFTEGLQRLSYATSA